MKIDVQKSLAAKGQLPDLRDPPSHESNHLLISDSIELLVPLLPSHLGVVRPFARFALK